MIQLSEAIIKVQKEYQDKVKEAVIEGLSPQEFKKYSGGMGVYPQKKDGHYMVRPRIYSGILNLKQLKGMNKLAKKYAGGKLHLTTRQSFQFHQVKLEDTVKIVNALLSLGIITVGAGGNSIRNISCPPLSGVDRQEVFDVTPHAEAATSFALNLEGMNTLPRKYKISFSNDSRDLAKATISDLGFIAKMQEGIRGFKVYGAGGIGNQPSAAITLKDFAPEEDILHHILAMKLLFEDHGDRSNRNKARIRFIAKRLGDDSFKQLYDNYLEEAKRDKSLKYIANGRQTLPVCAKQQANDESSISDGIRVIEQKNAGYYALYIHPHKGDISSELIDQIITYIEDLQEEPEMRLSNTQGMYIRNLKAADVEKLKEITEGCRIHSAFGRSVTCTGAKNCRIGLMDSQELLEEIKGALTDYNLAELKRLPEIRVSGCGNGCALHQTVLLGFEGSRLKLAQGHVQAYKIYVNGRIGDGTSTVSKSIGTVAKELIPYFMRDILEFLISHHIDGFENLLIEKPKFIKNLVNRYEERSRQCH